MHRIHFGSSATDADLIEFKQIENRLHGGLSRAGGKKCPLHGDVVFEIPLRRYESSCHSKIQRSTHPTYTQYMHADVLYTCCVTHLLCDLSWWNPCSAFDVPRPPCVLGLAPLCPTKLAILGRRIPNPESQDPGSKDFSFHFRAMCEPALSDMPLSPLSHPLEP